MSKHTPGPWTTWHDINELDEIYQAGVDTGDRSAGVCEIRCDNIDFDATKDCNERILADARLIASAPDLLAACKGLLDCCELNLDEMEPETLLRIIEARVAIAKAEGE